MALKRQGLIEQWHDRDISAGKDWKHEIDTYLNSAQIILLLISKNFIHSDYCYGIELSRAIQRVKQMRLPSFPFCFVRVIGRSFHSANIKFCRKISSQLPAGIGIIKMKPFGKLPRASER